MRFLRTIFNVAAFLATTVCAAAPKEDENDDKIKQAQEYYDSYKSF